MISREEAIELLNKYLKDKENLKKAVAAEAIMRKIAKRLNRNEELWGITGLLHNIDYEYTEDNLEERGSLSFQLITGLIPDAGVNAIMGTNYVYTEYVPVRSIDKALIAIVTLIKLIFKIIKSTSSQKISDVDLPIMYEKFKDTNFNERNDQKRIELINDIGINEQEFLKISLDALKEISDEIDI